MAKAKKPRAPKAGAKQGDKVKVQFTGTLEDGTVFESTPQGEPVEFTVGGGAMIPALEQAIVGMQPAESKTVVVRAGEAYGRRRDDLVVDMDRGKLFRGIELHAGQQVKLTDDRGQRYVAAVTRVTETSVTLDTNHPLAGKDLTFKIRLLDIK